MPSLRKSEKLEYYCSRNWRRRRMNDLLQWRPFSKCNSVYERINGSRKICCFSDGFLAFGAKVLFLLLISLAYKYWPPQSAVPVQKDEAPPSNSSAGRCNLFEGRWLPHRSYPLYKSCRYLENGFDCRGNGRKDLDYEKLRWKPTNCEIPSFDVNQALNLLRGKRVVFVGDSLARSQWESLVCMLSTGVDDDSIVSELKGDRINKHVQFLTALFSSFDIRIDFYRSFYLMKTGGVPKNSPEKVRVTLRLDEIDDLSKEWSDSDVLVFNSGEWWSESKLARQMGCYFRIGNSLHLEMSILDGFRKAIETWANWADTKLDKKRTKVFFRAYESTHWSDNDFKVCNVTKYPATETNGFDRSPFTRIVTDVLKNSTAPITVLQVSAMGAYRTDAHVGTLNRAHTPDCSHWCMPSVPEVWNEILLHLLRQQLRVSP